MSIFSEAVNKAKLESAIQQKYGKNGVRIFDQFSWSLEQDRSIEETKKQLNSALGGMDEKERAKLEATNQQVISHLLEVKRGAEEKLLHLCGLDGVRLDIMRNTPDGSQPGEYWMGNPTGPRIKVIDFRKEIKITL